MPYVFALLFFMVLVFTVIVWYIDSHNKQKKLSEKEKKLLERDKRIEHLEDTVIDEYDSRWDELEQEQKEL